MDQNKGGVGILGADFVSHRKIWDTNVYQEIVTWLENRPRPAFLPHPFFFFFLMAVVHLWKWNVIVGTENPAGISADSATCKNTHVHKYTQWARGSWPVRNLEKEEREFGRI